MGAGWFGLWFLSGKEITIRNENAAPAPADKNEETFSDVGGRTPKETLDLLITALEKDNLALAAKYFVPEIRDEESEDLKKLHDAKLMADLVQTLKGIKNGKAVDNSHYRFAVPDETGEIIAEIGMVKNATGLWKINSL